MRYEHGEYDGGRRWPTLGFRRDRKDAWPKRTKGGTGAVLEPMGFQNEADIADILRENGIDVYIDKPMD